MTFNVILCHCVSVHTSIWSDAIFVWYLSMLGRLINLSRDVRKTGFLHMLGRLINLSRDVIKPDFCICENKDADQLRGNREADQRLCFRYTDSTIPLLPKYKISSL